MCRDKSIEYILGQDDEMKFFKWVRVTERRNIKGKEKNTTFTIKQAQACHLSSMKTHFLKSLHIKKNFFKFRHQVWKYKNVRQQKRR